MYKSKERIVNMICISLFYFFRIPNLIQGSNKPNTSYTNQDQQDEITYRIKSFPVKSNEVSFSSDSETDYDSDHLRYIKNKRTSSHISIGVQSRLKKQVSQRRSMHQQKDYNHLLHRKNINDIFNIPQRSDLSRKNDESREYAMKKSNRRSLDCDVTHNRWLPPLHSNIQHLRNVNGRDCEKKSLYCSENKNNSSKNMIKDCGKSSINISEIALNSIYSYPCDAVNNYSKFHKTNDIYSTPYEDPKISTENTKEKSFKNRSKNDSLFYEGPKISTENTVEKSSRDRLRDDFLRNKNVIDNIECIKCLERSEAQNFNEKKNTDRISRSINGINSEKSQFQAELHAEELHREKTTPNSITTTNGQKSNSLYHLNLLMDEIDEIQRSLGEKIENKNCQSPNQKSAFKWQNNKQNLQKDQKKQPDPDFKSSKDFQICHIMDDRNKIRNQIVVKKDRISKRKCRSRRINGQINRRHTDYIITKRNSIYETDSDEDFTEILNKKVPRYSKSSSQIRKSIISKRFDNVDVQTQENIHNSVNPLNIQTFDKKSNESDNLSVYENLPKDEHDYEQIPEIFSDEIKHGEIKLDNKIQKGSCGKTKKRGFFKKLFSCGIQAEEGFAVDNTFIFYDGLNYTDGNKSECNISSSNKESDKNDLDRSFKNCNNEFNFENLTPKKLDKNNARRQ